MQNKLQPVEEQTMSYAELIELITILMSRLEELEEKGRISKNDAFIKDCELEEKIIRLDNRTVKMGNRIDNLRNKVTELNHKITELSYAIEFNEE